LGETLGRKELFMSSVPVLREVFSLVTTIPITI